MLIFKDTSDYKSFLAYPISLSAMNVLIVLEKNSGIVVAVAMKVVADEDDQTVL